MNILLVGNFFKSIHSHWNFLVPYIKELGALNGVKSGEEAINAYSVLQPDVIFAEVLLPGMSGFEMGRIIKEQHENARVILVSEEFNREFFSTAIDIGLGGYLSKNMKDHALSQAIADLTKNQYRFATLITPAMI